MVPHLLDTLLEKANWSCHCICDFSQIVVCLLGFWLTNRIKSHLGTNLSTYITRENNGFNSHAQETTTFQPNISVTRMHQFRSYKSNFPCTITAKLKLFLWVDNSTDVSYGPTASILQPGNAGKVHVNVTLRRFQITVVTVQSKKYYIFWVCVCNFSYPACNAHAPNYIVFCGQSGCTKFFHTWWDLIRKTRAVDKEVFVL